MGSCKRLWPFCPTEHFSYSFSVHIVLFLFCEINEWKNEWTIAFVYAWLQDYSGSADSNDASSRLYTEDLQSDHDSPNAQPAYVDTNNSDSGLQSPMPLSNSSADRELFGRPRAFPVVAVGYLRRGSWLRIRPILCACLCKALADSRSLAAKSTGWPQKMAQFFVRLNFAKY